MKLEEEAKRFMQSRNNRRDEYQEKVVTAIYPKKDAYPIYLKD